MKYFKQFIITYLFNVSVFPVSLIDRVKIDPDHIFYIVRGVEGCICRAEFKTQLKKT